MSRKPQGSAEYRKYKQEVSRKVSMANKRLRRLERNDLHSSPAYREWKKMKGGKNFSVRNKEYRELQKENARLNHFLQSKTSTVRGANKVLKAMAKNTGMKYHGMKELHAKSAKFFKLASKVSQYLHSANGASGAIGYQAVWHSVNNYMEKQAPSNTESAVSHITRSIQRDYEQQNDHDDFDMWKKI